MGSVSEKTAAADARRELAPAAAAPAAPAARDHAAFGQLALPAVVAAAHMATRGRQRGSTPGAGR